MQKSEVRFFSFPIGPDKDLVITKPSTPAVFSGQNYLNHAGAGAARFIREIRRGQFFMSYGIRMFEADWFPLRFNADASAVLGMR